MGAEQDDEWLEIREGGQPRALDNWAKGGWPEDMGEARPGLAVGGACVGEALLWLRNFVAVQL